MDTATIVLLSLIGVGVLIVVSLTLSLFFEANKRRREQIKHLNDMRNEIQLRLNICMEDDKLNETERRYPELTEVIEDYKEARNSYFGIERTSESKRTED